MPDNQDLLNELIIARKKMAGYKMYPAHAELNEVRDHIEKTLKSRGNPQVPNEVLSQLVDDYAKHKGTIEADRVAKGMEHHPYLSNRLDELLAAHNKLTPIGPNPSRNGHNIDPKAPATAPAKQPAAPTTQKASPRTPIAHHANSLREAEQRLEHEINTRKNVGAYPAAFKNEAEYYAHLNQLHAEAQTAVQYHYKHGGEAVPHTVIDEMISSNDTRKLIDGRQRDLHSELDKRMQHHAKQYSEAVPQVPTSKVRVVDESKLDIPEVLSAEKTAAKAGKAAAKTRKGVATVVTGVEESYAKTLASVLPTGKAAAKTESGLVKAFGKAKNAGKWVAVGAAGLAFLGGLAYFTRSGKSPAVRQLPEPLDDGLELPDVSGRPVLGQFTARALGVPGNNPAMQPNVVGGDGQPPAVLGGPG